jgi:hypothetical protein
VEASTVPSSIEVLVSAGAPVAGATVTVLAINDASGEVNTAAGAGGVLGSAGPTGANGRITVSLRSYSGPVQIVARGPALFYPDPTSGNDGSGEAATIQVPSAFEFSSYVPSFRAGAGAVPVTLLTTLADHAALAYARGRHSSHPARTTITEALAARDPLLTTHVTKAAAAWDPGSLRSTTPAMLTNGPQSLVDVAFAALFDLGLNQLARDTAVRAGYGTGPGGLTAPTLVQLLAQDLDADGRLDGIGEDGRQIWTAGSTPVAVDTQFLRKPLAVSLATWVRNTEANRSGITDADLASAQVFSTITEDTSDLFGSAPTEPFDPLDRTPPVIAFAGSPPGFTSSFDVTLTVDASDSSGVSAVYALVGATRRQGLLQDGRWVIDVSLPSVGHNTVVVWAEDTAQPAPNSGEGLEGPYQLSVDIVYDPDAPAAVYDSAFASYADERSLSVAVGADGILATVPAIYEEGDRTAIPNGGHIYKAATRLSASGALDAAEFEGTNVANIPVLRFSVPFNPNTDAPITTAEFRVDVACAGCGTVPTAVGALLPSPTAVPQALYFDLPLSVETVPALAWLPGPASLTVALHLADAAGNAATVGAFNFTFHVVGPPLAVVEDAGYAGYGDPRSTYPYRIAGVVDGVDTYATLFDPSSPAFYDGEVRLLRYVVSNPSPEAVAIVPSFTQAPGGSWQVTETWPRRSYGEPPAAPVLNDHSTATPYVIDGFTFYQALYWAMPYGTAGAGLPKTETAPHPCVSHTNGWPAHRIGDTVNKWVCPGVTIGSPDTTAVFASSVVTPAVYAGFQQGGGEVLSPEMDVTGTAFVVPGAVGATPGILVVYLTRPLSAARNRPLQKNVLGNTDEYEIHDYEVFWPYYTWSYFGRYGAFTYEVYLMLRSGQYLESASESLAGSLSVSTQGLVGSTLFGEPATPFSTTYSRTIAIH